MKKLILLLLLSLGFTGAANGDHKEFHFHFWASPNVLFSAVYYAELMCELNGKEVGLQMCLDAGTPSSPKKFLELTKNNISKSYSPTDFIRRIEELRFCGWPITNERGCFFYLPEHFTIKVWRGSPNDGYAKLVLKIFNKNEDILYHNETSDWGASMTVYH